MKIVFLGFVASCLFGGLTVASPIADNADNEATPTRNWNMPLTTELVDFGKTGFLFKRDAESAHISTKKLEKRKSKYSNSGKGTFFTPGKGSCGWKNTKKDLIVAVSGGGGKNPNCGRTVEIMNAAGKTVKAKVVDTCPSCSKGDLDLSPAAFIKLAPYSQGVVKIQWKYTN